MEAQQFEMIMEMLREIKHTQQADRAEWRQALENNSLEWKKAREEDKAEWKKAREEDRALFQREFDNITYLIKNETEERRRIEKKVDAVYDERKNSTVKWNAGFLGLNTVFSGMIALIVSVWK